MAEDGKSLDVLGIKPVSESIKAVTEGAVKGAAAFLSRICLPAAEEFGLLIRDKVSRWRTENALKITQKAERLVSDRESGSMIQAHPRLVMMAIEEGSWSSDDQVQRMWAGLLSSSCDETGEKEDNLLFMNTLKSLTALQAKALEYSVERCSKFATEAGLTFCNKRDVLIEQFMTDMGVKDLHDLDYQLDHLRSLELWTEESGVDPYGTIVRMHPTSLGLAMYVRCQGFVGSPIDYFPDVEKLDAAAALARFGSTVPDL